MTYFRYIIIISIFSIFSTLVFTGCGEQRLTTMFSLTPTMEDGTTTPARLTKELDDELQFEDTKRRKVLQEKAKEESESAGGK